MKIYLISLMIFICANIAHAKSCRNTFNIADLDKENAYAFIGHVEEKVGDLSLFNNKYRIKVDSIYKGELPSEIIVWTPILSKCGINFRVGDTYVVFARKNRSKIWTGLTSSWRIYDKTDDRTKEFQNFYDLKKQSGE